jgi:hypothetical protein
VDFHNPKCGLRWRRAHPDDRRTCTGHLGATDNTEVSEGVFTVTRRSGLFTHNQSALNAQRGGREWQSANCFSPLRKPH